MAGIQSAIGGALSAIAAATIAGKKIHEDEKQAEEKRQEKEAKAIEKAQRSSKREESIKSIVEKVLLEAQKKGLNKNNSVLFDAGGKPLATAPEAASVLASTSLQQHLASSKATKQAKANRLNIVKGRKR